MKFFVRYSTGKYDGQEWIELEGEQQVIDLLNLHAGNPEFTFDVIHGRRILFEAVSVATQYRKK